MNPSQEKGAYMGQAVSRVPTPMGLMLGSYTDPPTQLEILKQKKEALEHELEKVNAAIQALEEHPEIEKVMSLVQKALY